MSLEQHRIAEAFNQSAVAQMLERGAQTVQAGMENLVEWIATPLNAMSDKLRNMEAGPNMLAGAAEKIKGAMPGLPGGGDDLAIDSPAKTPNAPSQELAKAITPSLPQKSTEITTAMADFRSCVEHNSGHDCSIEQLGAVEPLHYRNANMKQISAGVSV